MKTISKILGLVLALSLVLSFAAFASAVAAPESKDIIAAAGDFSSADKTIVWTSDNFTFKVDQGTNTNAIRTSDNDHFRVYKGNAVTITALNSEKISKVVITVTSNDYVSVLQASAPSNAIVSVDGNDVTLSFATAVESVEIGATAQWRLNKIVVTFYDPNAACEHAFSGCDDTTCDLDCGHTRTALDHEYTNEYDTSCNNCTTGTRTVTLPAADSTLTLDVANKLGLAHSNNTYTSDKYYVTGTIVGTPDATYGTVYIEDANGNKFYIYGIYSWEGATRYDAMTDKPVEGDTVTLYGVIGTYNGREAQMKNAWLKVEAASCEHEYTNEYDATCNGCGEPRDVTLPAADSVLTLDVAELLGLAQGHNSYTSDKYYVEGVITKITNDTYGNLVIEDDDGNTFVIYGSLDATGTTEYADMTAPHAVGDTVKVYGFVGQYNGSAQIKNGWVTVTERAPSTNTPPTGDSTMLIPAVVVAALSVTGMALVIKKKDF